VTRPRRWDSRLPALAAVTAYVVGEIGAFVMPLLVSEFIEGFDLAEGTVGFVVALQLGSLALAALLLAPRLGRFGPRRVALAGVAMTAAGGVLTAAADDAAMLLVARALVGFGEGCIHASGTAAAARSADPERTFSTAWLAVVGMSLAVFLLVPRLLETLGAPVVFVLLGVIPLAAIPVLLRLPGPDAADAPHSSVRRVPLREWLTPTALRLCLAAGLFAIAANGAWFYAERIGAPLGLRPTDIGSILALASVLAAIAPPLARAALPAIGRRACLAIAAATVGGGVGLMTLVPSAHAFGIGVCTASVGLVFGSVVFMAIAARLDPLGRVAVASRGVGMAGNTLTPALAGALLLAGGGYAAIGITALIASILVLVLGWRAAAAIDSRLLANGQVAPADERHAQS